jgi:hypothetical protein
MKAARAFLFFLIAVGTLAAKDFWLEEDYTKWDRKETIKMLSDSPWAQTQSFIESMLLSGSTGQVVGNTGGGIQPSGPPTGGPPSSQTGADVSGPTLRGDHQASLLYYVRFYSALPIRQAMVQLQVLGGKTPGPEAIDKFLNQPPFPDDLIIAVATAPGQDRQEFEVITTDLIKNETWLIKKNKQRIQLREYMSPSKSGASEAYYLFPRFAEGKPTVELQDGEIRFVTKLGKRELNRSFKLAKMVLNGKLAL